MKVQGTHYRSIWYDYKDCQVKIIDQRWLPHDFRIVALTNLDEFAVAIRDMWVRGAPLIGATAAYGVAISLSSDASDSGLKNTYDTLIETRPTAINLKWALDRLLRALGQVSQEERAKKALELAHLVAEEDVGINKKIGEHGLEIVKKIASNKPAGEPVRMLTHCNAGWPATVDWGTATSPMYHAHEAGIPIHVWVDETRPRNQGANLTSYELNEEGIENTIIADNTGGILMNRGEVDICIVGTDRTLANGDVCNKVGTYLKALAAKDNNIPFYVALPSSTIDWTTKSSKEIIIEERASEELSKIEGLDEYGKIVKVQIYPKRSKAMNIAFDITPAKYITGLITEKGICEPSENSLRKVFKK